MSGPWLVSSHFIACFFLVSTRAMWVWSMINSAPYPAKVENYKQTVHFLLSSIFSGKPIGEDEDVVALLSEDQLAAMAVISTS